ncbi:MAG TPA: glycogen phosphorylase [Ruminococcaceae bacterium]|nr:glycogen phosphorylase [Oscillospiraceae bacterium]
MIYGGFIMPENEIIRETELLLSEKYGCGFKEAAPYELHDALSRSIMDYIAKGWHESEERYAKGRRVFYFSAEFLVGRAIYNNLLALGLTKEISEALAEKGADINRLDEVEDAALGNGGLGRLAACFLDSAATHACPVTGYGIRYRYGLFRQEFSDGFQTEKPDDWARYGDPWSVRREREAVTVRFADMEVRAVPYDMPVIGYGGKNINTLRLWQCEPVSGFDFKKFNEGRYDEAVEGKNRAEDISRVLYPNDETEEGKVLRIRQEYFFCSASVQDILRGYVKAYGGDFSRLSDYCAVQLNDTHPAVAVCELIRLLCDLYGMEFEEAFAVTRGMFHYTNHTVMAESLEKWDGEIYGRILPDVYKYIKKINERQQSEFNEKGGAFAENLGKCAVINGGVINMANLAVYASSTVNGVAKIHTEILKHDVLKEWYALIPDNFQNKTNGITPRRWLALCNPELSSLITRLLGNDGWITDLSLIKGIEKFSGDANAIDEFAQIKRIKKRRLAGCILKKENVVIPSDFMFDIQVKRMHEYKRQLLNAFSILYIYFGLKDGSIKDFAPTAFIFGAKAAPGYVRAKGIIKFINEIASMVNGDAGVKDLMKVVFVQNYDVSYAEKLVCAADISEQISTAGTEASGTGNMKFMLNGAPTLGTYDGANIEIVGESGEENNYIFGAKVEQLDAIRDSYDPRAVYDGDNAVKRVVDTLVDGTFSDGGTGVFRGLYDSILKGASWHRPDQYFLLYDFKPYIEAKLRANRDFKDTRAFARKGFINTANAGRFSSDRAVAEYARDIWKVKFN